MRWPPSGHSRLGWGATVSSLKPAPAKNWMNGGKVMPASCPNCGKLYANPLTHVCPSRRGDVKRRKAAADKRAKAAAPKVQRPQYDYRTCRDPGCRRYGCQAFRDGCERGAADAEALAEARNR